jgi:hypothetical protein
MDESVAAIRRRFAVEDHDAAGPRGAERLRGGQAGPRGADDQDAARRPVADPLRDVRQTG